MSKRKISIDFKSLKFITRLIKNTGFIKGKERLPQNIPLYNCILLLTGFKTGLNLYRIVSVGVALTKIHSEISILWVGGPSKRNPELIGELTFNQPWDQESSQ